MCGIAGWSMEPGALQNTDALLRMTQALAHRGPDGEGHWIDAQRGVALGHRRLSIIDLSNASAQPMVDPSGAVLSYNGELYNYRALRAELEAAGHCFTTSGDTEVVLRALLVWGVDALRKFCGMFALAYLPPGDDTLLLARDPLGIKPLLYCDAGKGGLAFASELRALLAGGFAQRRLDTLALGQYLEFGYAFDGERGMLAGVRKVAPGEWLRVRRGRIVDRRQYYLAPTAAEESLPDADTLDAVLGQVVAEHLVADVPVGVLLSGGLDSSVIAALAARTGEVTTLSFGFGDSVIDERAHARSVAQAIGSRHIEFVIEPHDAIRQLEDAPDVFDDLIADGAVLSTRLAYREARRLGIKVVLVGEGADELFGGYSIFSAATRLRGPRMLRRFQLYRRYCGMRYGDQYASFARDLGDDDHLGGAPWVETVRRFEVEHQLPNQYVMKVDHASMAESVEARVPYLDRRVADLALRIPADRLGCDAEGKRPLRALARRLGVLPTAIVERPKYGASLAPEWLSQSAELRKLASDALLPPTSLGMRLGFGRVLRRFLVEGGESLPLPSRHGVLNQTVWRLLLLELWCRRLAISL